MVFGICRLLVLSREFGKQLFSAGGEFMISSEFVGRLE
jgi:hypothetical protein